MLSGLRLPRSQGQKQDLTNARTFLPSVLTCTPPLKSPCVEERSEIKPGGSIRGRNLSASIRDIPASRSLRTGQA